MAFAQPCALTFEPTDLRSVAPKEIKTGDIYWGAVPFVVIQVAMVVLVLAFPQLVGHAVSTTATGVMEVPLDSGVGDSFLPPEWK